MDRNNKFLAFLLVCLSLFTFTDCSEDKKSIYDTEKKFFNLSEATGKYYYLPSVNDEDYPNYETFDLKKGDSILLNINSDSSFIFNHFYYNKNRDINTADKIDKINKLDNYKGKLEFSKYEKIKESVGVIFPKNSSYNLQGFLAFENDTVFYYRLSMKGYSNYTYRFNFKKF